MSGWLLGHHSSARAPSQMRGPAIVAAPLNGGRTGGTACSAFMFEVTVEESHDAGVWPIANVFFRSQVHQRRGRSFTADPVCLDRGVAVVELRNARTVFRLRADPGTTESQRQITRAAACQVVNF